MPWGAGKKPLTTLQEIKTSQEKESNGVENPHALELFVPITPSGSPCNARPQVGSAGIKSQAHDFHKDTFVEMTFRLLFLALGYVTFPASTEANS